MKGLQLEMRLKVMFAQLIDFTLLFATFTFELTLAHANYSPLCDAFQPSFELLLGKLAFIHLISGPFRANTVQLCDVESYCVQFATMCE